MKKSTAGIFSVLLGLMAFGSADAAVVSTEYLNEKLGLELEKKQDVLDTTGSLVTISEDNKIDVTIGAIGEGATNLVTGGVVHTALEAEKSARELAEAGLQDAIDTKLAITNYQEYVAAQKTLNEGQDASIATNAENIGKNAEAIATLNGDESVAGSVKSQIKSLSDSLGGTTQDLTNLTGRVTSAEGAIQVLNGDGDGSVSKSIATAIDGLDKEDTAVAGQFVTSVSEQNGVIVVSRAELAASDIPTLSIEKVQGLQDALDAKQVQLSNEDGAIVISQDGVISIAAQGITSAMIKDGAIVEAKLATDSVTTNKIKDGAVTAGKIAADAVSEATIVNGAVTTDKIGAGAITNEKLGSQAVKGANIEDNAVGTQQLAADVNSLLTGAIQAPTTENAEGTFVLTAKKVTVDGAVSYTYAWEDIAGRSE